MNRSSRLATVEEALDALREGRPVLVVDDEDRENEGDVVLAAETLTERWTAWAVRHSSGYLCAPVTPEVADRLGLPLMVPDNHDPLRTAYTVTVDAAVGVDHRDLGRRPHPHRPRPGRPRPRPRRTCAAPATSCRCGPARAASSPGPATPRPPSTSAASLAWPRSGSSASWSRTTAR